MNIKLTVRLKKQTPIPGEYVVKVQLPIVTNEPEPMALVYDQNRSYAVYTTIPHELRRLLPWPKGYFRAVCSPTTVTLLEKVKDRDW